MLLAALLASTLQSSPASTDTPGTVGEPRIPMRILYAGAPGTEREADWLAFLRENFVTADAVSLRDVTRDSAGAYDVVVADWSWRYLAAQGSGVLDLGEGAQGYRLRESIPTPMVMVGGLGGELEQRTKLGSL